MAFKFHCIPVHDDGRAAAELNAFLRSHRVLHIDRQWVDQGSDSFWHFCIDYWDSSDTQPAAGRNGRSRKRVDYRLVLPPEQFVVFARLRDWRNEMAKKGSTPPYTIFDNEQLAEMVTKGITTKEELAKIAGIGESRVEKYGEAVLELLNAIKESNDAKSGEPVAPDPGTR